MIENLEIFVYPPQVKAILGQNEIFQNVLIRRLLEVDTHTVLEILDL